VNQQIEKTDRQRRVLAFCLCLAILLLRCRMRLVHDHLWAEDGAVFLHDALEFGPRDLVMPYRGYFHTIPRLFTHIFLFFPIAWFARLIGYTCLAMHAWVISGFSRRIYDYLIPNHVARFLACLSLSLFPAMHEIAANLTNLHWVLYLWLLLFALRDISEKIRLRELIMIFLVALSAGETVTLIPVFLVRVWLTYQRDSLPLAPLAKELTAPVLLLSVAVFNSFPQSADRLHHGESQVSVFYLLRLLCDYVFNRLFLHPFAGEWLTSRLAKRLGWGAFLVGLMLAIFLVRELKKIWKREHCLFVLAAAGAFGVMLMTAIVRPESLPVLLTTTVPFHIWRYSFIPGNLAVLIAFTATQGLQLWPTRPWVLPLLIAAMCVFHTLTQFNIPRFGENYGWYHRSSAPLAAALKEECPNPVVIPINPAGWSFTVSKATHKPTCTQR
jgi:hypothetical protein